MRFAPGHILYLFVALLGVASAVGCRKGETAVVVPGSNVVATVAGTPIFAEALSAEIARRHGGSGGAVTADQRKAALESLIRREALYARAVASGFDQKPEIQAKVRGMVAERFADSAFPVVAEPVSDMSVSNAYVAEREKYAVPAAVRYSAISILSPMKGTSEAKAAVASRAAAVAAEAKAAPAMFAAIAARVSEDQVTRYRGGDFGWINLDAGGADPAVIAELKKISRPGDVGDLVRTEKGFLIVQLADRRAATVRPFSEVRDRIRHELVRRASDDAERRNGVAIRNGLDIQIFQERVDAIPAPAGESRPPGGPGSIRTEVSRSESKRVSQ